jgi:hypothetical protein
MQGMFMKRRKCKENVEKEGRSSKRRRKRKKSVIIKAMVIMLIILKPQRRRARLSPFSTCIARCIMEDYLCEEQSRRRKQKRVRNIFYGSVSEIICRTEGINEESKREIRFRFREKRSTKSSYWRRKLSLSCEIYRTKGTITRARKALTVYFWLRR